MSTQTTTADLSSQIKDEQLLKKMWETTEDFAEKKEIRSQMYKLREERLKEFYNNSNTTTNQKNLHVDSLNDHSFISMKTKEIRDSESPTRDLSCCGNNGNPSINLNKGWNIITKNDVSDDGKTQTVSHLATASGTDQIPGGQLDFICKNEDSGMLYQDGDADNYKKSAGTSSTSFIKQEAVGGDAHSQFKTLSTKSSSSSAFVNEQKTTIKDHQIIDPNTQITRESDGMILTESRSKTLQQSQKFIDEMKTTSSSSINKQVSQSKENFQQKYDKQPCTELVIVDQSNKQLIQKENFALEKVDTNEKRQIVEYKNEMTNKKISVDLSPTHEAFARSLRTVSPDRINSFRISPDKESKSSKKSVSNETITYSSSSKKTETICDNLRPTTLEITKKTRKITDRSPTSPLTDFGSGSKSPVKDTRRNSLKDVSPSKDRTFKRTDTYEERCKQILGLSSETHIDKKKFVTKTRSSDDFNKKKSTTRDVSSPTRKTPKSPVKNVNTFVCPPEKKQPFISTVAQEKTTKSEEFLKMEIKSSDELRKSKELLEFPAQIRRTPEKEPMEKYPEKKTIDKEGLKISEFPAQIRKSTELVCTIQEKHDEFLQKEIDEETENLNIKYSETRKSNEILEFPSQIRRSPEREPRERYNSPSRKSPSPARESPKLLEFPSQIRRSPEREPLEKYPEKKKPIKEAPKICEFPSQIRRSPEREPLEKYPEKKKPIKEAPTICEFPSQIRRSPEREPLEKYPEKKKPIKEAPTICEFPSQIRRSPEREPLEKYPEKKKPIKEAPKICEFPSQIRRSPEREPLEKYPEKKKPIKEAPTICEFPSQIRRSPEREPLEKYPEKKKPIKEAPTICEFPSQIRRSPEREPLEKYPEKKKPIKEAPKICEFPSQIRRSPEREPLEKYPEKKKPIKEAPKICEFPSQIRRSPEREPLEKYPEKKKPIKEAPKICEFPSQIRRSPEREPLEKYPEKKKPIKEAPKICEFPSQIRRSPEREPLEKYPEKKKPIKEAPKICEFPSQIRRSPEREPLEKYPEKKKPIKEAPTICEFPSQIRTSPEREPLEKYPEKKKPIKEAPKICEFPSQIRRSTERYPEKNSCDLIPRQTSPIREVITIKQFPSEILESHHQDTFEKITSQKNIQTEKINNNYNETLHTTEYSTFKKSPSPESSFYLQKDIRSSVESLEMSSHREEFKNYENLEYSHPIKDSIECTVEIKSTSNFSDRKSLENEISRKKTISEKSSQNRKSSEKQSTKKYAEKKKSPKISEFPSQIRKSPEKGTTNTCPSPIKKFYSSTQESPKISEFPSQRRTKSPESSDKRPSKVIQKSPERKKSVTITDTDIQIIKSPIKKSINEKNDIYETTEKSKIFIEKRFTPTKNCTVQVQKKNYKPKNSHVENKTPVYEPPFIKKHSYKVGEDDENQKEETKKINRISLENQILKTSPKSNKTVKKDSPEKYYFKPQSNIEKNLRKTEKKQESKKTTTSKISLKNLKNLDEQKVIRSKVEPKKQIFTTTIIMSPKTKPTSSTNTKITRKSKISNGIVSDSDDDRKNVQISSNKTTKRTDQIETKCITTKSIMINNDNLMGKKPQIVVNLRRSESSRDPSPDHIYPRPLSPYASTTRETSPRYPDQIIEPEDGYKSKPLSDLYENIQQGDDTKITEINDKVDQFFKTAEHVTTSQYHERSECQLSSDNKNQDDTLTSHFITTKSKQMIQTDHNIKPSFHLNQKSNELIDIDNSMSDYKKSHTTLFKDDAWKKPDFKEELKKSGFKDEWNRNEILNTKSNLYQKPDSSLSKKNPTECVQIEDEEQMYTRTLSSKQQSPETGTNFQNRLKSTETIKKAKAIFENKQNDILSRPSIFEARKKLDFTEEKCRKVDKTNSESLDKDINEEQQTPGYMKPLDRKLRPNSPHRDSIIEGKPTKFGITLRRTSSGRFSTNTTATTNERKTSLINISEEEIEEIYDLDILEELLEKIINYDLRRKIRSQIRIVKKMYSENQIDKIKENTEIIEKITKIFHLKRKPKLFNRNKSKSPQRQHQQQDTDLITSSYGIGPTDENGSPLFGLKALRSKNKTDTTKVQGTIIKSQCYSENGKEPIGHITITKYSTDPKDLGSEGKNVTSVTTTQKFGSEDLQTTKTKGFNEETSKVTTRLEEESIIDNSVSVDERQASSSSILLSTIGKKEDSLHSEMTTKIRCSGTTTKDTFLTDHSPVKNVQDVLCRMENKDIREGETAEDAEARSLLNKFIGSQVLLSGFENVEKKKTTKVTITTMEGDQPVSKTLVFEHPICEEKLKTIWDEETLRFLLEQCSDYEERRRIRARLRQVMSEQDACMELVDKACEETMSSGNIEDFSSINKISEGPVMTTTQVTTRIATQQQQQQQQSSTNKPISPFAKFRQLDKQNSLNTPPSTPKTPSGSGPFFKFTDPALSQSASTVKERLLQWCRMKTKEYENIQLDNFSSSWADGLAFCALIHHFLPDSFDYCTLSSKNRRYNFTLAFQVADEKADIAPLLDVDDMVACRKPDWKCVFTYVQSIYRRFKDED